MKQTNTEALLRSAKRAVRKFGRKASAGIITVAAIGASIPYKVEKVRNPETGDDGYVATSLLLRASVSPKCEDSVENKTRVTVRLRPPKEIGADLQRIEQKCAKKKEPAPLPEAKAEPEALIIEEVSDESSLAEAKAVYKEEKALNKARKKVRKLEKKVAKKRAARAKKAKRKH